MKLFAVILLVCGICLGGNAWADETSKDNCVLVASGDTLSKIARTLDSTVSELAKKNGIQNPDIIHPDQKICREGNAPKENTTPKQKPEEKQRAPHMGVTGITDTVIPEGYTPYSTTGVNPLVRQCPVDAVSPIEKVALARIGVSSSDVENIEREISSGTVHQTLVPAGTKFSVMTEHGRRKNSVRVAYNLIATWGIPKQGLVFDLPDGRKIARLDCCNWAQVEVPPKEPEPSIAVAAVTPEPEVTPEEQGVELCGLDDHDLFGSIGRTDGNGSKTGWRYADGFACIAKGRVDGGTVKGGIGGLYGDSKGHATTDGFVYSGERYGWGPTVKYVDDDGWDARSSFFPWGKFLNDGHNANGDYAQTRDFDMRGSNFGFNLYWRELAGEKWFPKTQIYGSAFKLFDQDLQHSWQGNQIADTSDLKSSWLLSLGIREFIYQGPVKPWISLEYFAEIPHTRNLTGMLGVTDEDEILWAGIGLTRNLEKGGYARTGMVGIDVGNGIRKLRSNVRHDEWVSTETSYYDEATGAFTLKRPESGTDATRVAKFDVATGSFGRTNGDATPVQPIMQVAKTDVRQAPSRTSRSLMKSDGEQTRWTYAGFGNKTQFNALPAVKSPVQKATVAKSATDSGFGGWNNR